MTKNRETLMRRIGLIPYWTSGIGSKSLPLYCSQSSDERIDWANVLLIDCMIVL